MGELLLRGGLFSRLPFTAVVETETGYRAQVQSSTAFANLVAWLELDSAPPVDTLGNLTPGSVVGGVTFPVGELPDADIPVADFDGTSGYMTFADAAALHLSECAFHFAVQIDSFPAVSDFRVLISKEGTGLTDQDFLLGLFNNAGVQELRAQFIISGAPQRATISNVTLGTHWVTLNVGGGLDLELYVDGTSASNATYSAGINTNTRNLLIGAVNLGTGAGSFFEGRMKHVQIYNRRLTADERAWLSTPAFVSHGLVDFVDLNASRYYSFPHASVLDFPAGIGAWGFWTKVEENTGTLYQYALGSGTLGAAPSFNVYLAEATEAVNPNKFAFVITDNVGVGGSAARVSSAATGADGVERLVVVQSTGSAVEMWLCPKDGTATQVYTAALSLGALTAPVDWNLGRRTDGNASRYWEEWLGGLFKSNVALSQAQIEQIAGGSSPVAVLGTNCAAFWPFVDGAVVTEPDVVNSIAATRQGEWGTGGGIAQGFVQDVGIATHPSVVWHETWEDGNTVGWSPFNDSTGSFVITTTAANVHTGTRSLEWIIGQSTGDSGGNINRFLTATLPTMHMRWYVKYEAAWDNSPNYQNHTGCSIRGCGPSGCTAAGVAADGVNKFSVSLEPVQYAEASLPTVADYPPPGRMQLYSYHLGAGSFGERIDPNLNPTAAQLTPGQWHCCELMVQVNDIGLANGIVRAWVDGVQIHEHTTFNFRTSSTLLISEGRFNFYIHENNARTNRMWVDDIVYATEYIGPMRTS